MTASRPHPALRSLLAVVASFAMALALVPAVAVAQEGQARDLDGGICDDPESSFPDITTPGIQRAAGCIADYRIAQGYPDGRYRPGIAVNRAQMATFLARTLAAADDYDQYDDVPPYPYQDRGDFPAAHESNIDRISWEGIAGGREDGTYGPAEAVRRANMAVFVVNAIEQMIDDEMEGGDEDYFDDIDEDHWASEHINKLAHAGIVTGVSENTYSPGTHVTRGQMALFLARTLDFLVEEHEFTFTPVGPGEEAEDGQYEGELVRLNTRDNWFDAEIRLGETEDETDRLTFFYSEEDGDEFFLILSEEGPDELTESEWECVAWQTLDQDAEHSLAIDYSRADASEFGISTDADIEICFPEEAESGGYAQATIHDIDTVEQTILADVDVGTTTGWVLFRYFDSDTFRVTSQETGPLGEVELEEFECVVEVIIGTDADHTFNAEYDDAEGEESDSEFHVGTQEDVSDCFADDEGDNGGGGE